MSDDEEEQSTFCGVAVPNDLKSLRACKVCTLIMTYDQFYRNGKFIFLFSTHFLNIREHRFREIGCLNCTDLKIAESRDGISKFTTPHFEGIIGLIKPKVLLHFFLFLFLFSLLVVHNLPTPFLFLQKSWIAKYQRLVHKVKGTYACSVFDTPSPELLGELKAAGLSYVDRTNDITASSKK